MGIPFIATLTGVGVVPEQNVPPPEMVAVGKGSMLIAWVPVALLLQFASEIDVNTYVPGELPRLTLELLLPFNV